MKILLYQRLFSLSQGVRRQTSAKYYVRCFYEKIPYFKSFRHHRPRDKLVTYYLTAYDLDVQRQNMAQEKSLVGRVTYANGDAQDFTDAEVFLKCVREELPYRPTTGLRYEVMTDDPAVRKAVDDIVFDLYGEENPRQLEEYQKTPKQGMTMGGIK